MSKTEAVVSILGDFGQGLFLGFIVLIIVLLLMAIMKD